MIDVCRLICVGYDTEPGGNQQEKITRDRTVYAEVKSIGMRETYAALAVEHNPEIKIVLRNADDYDGESYAVYKGQQYKILRIYRVGFKIELILERTHDLEGMI